MDSKLYISLNELEDFAFYESGLCAHGCLDCLDIYTKKCIIRYGRILLQKQNELSPNTKITL